MPVEFKGSCLCGQVRYLISGAIADVSHCHCSMCRKAHGAAFATYATVPAAAHRILRGANVLRAISVSGRAERSFCSKCGSPMLWINNTEFPGVVSFPLGSLDTPFRPAVERHIFVSSKAPWHQITDSWPRSE